MQKKLGVERGLDALVVFASPAHQGDVLAKELRCLAEARCAIFGSTSCQSVMGSGFSGRVLGQRDGGQKGTVEWNSLELFGISDPSGVYAACSTGDIEEGGMEGIRERTKGAVASARRNAMQEEVHGMGEAPRVVLLAAPVGQEERVLRGITEASGGTPVFGGSAADDDLSGRWWQLMSGDTVALSGAAMLLLWPSVGTFIQLSLLYKDAQGSGKVTALRRGDPRETMEINGEPATSVYNRWCGGAFDAELAECEREGAPDAISVVAKSVNFPLGQRPTALAEYVSLVHPLHLRPGGAISVGSNVGESGTIECMSSSTTQLVESVPATMRSLVVTSDFRDGDGAELFGGLVIYCGGMRMRVGECIDEVAHTIDNAFDGVPWAGHFTFGEQGPGHKQGRLSAALS